MSVITNEMPPFRDLLTLGQEMWAVVSSALLLTVASCAGYWLTRLQAPCL